MRNILRFATIVLTKRIQQRSVLLAIPKPRNHNTLHSILETAFIEHSLVRKASPIPKDIYPKFGVLYDTILDAHAQSPEHQCDDPVRFTNVLVSHPSLLGGKGPRSVADPPVFSGMLAIEGRESKLWTHARAAYQVEILPRLQVWYRRLHLLPDAIHDPLEDLEAGETANTTSV